MRELGGRFGVLIALALALTILPSASAEAACSPRLFRELGPAPNRAAAANAEDAAAGDTGEETAPAAAVTPAPPRCSFSYDMDHPIAGPSAPLSVFGAIRAGGDRWHAGLDLSAAKLTPVVAVRSGTVREVNRNGEGDCCWVKIQHTDGWRSLYVHLNNDLAGGDMGDGVGIVRNLRVGDSVRRGEVIGYVGDSGNAEPGVPHLHFELRTPWDESVDPLPSIRRAERRTPTAFAGMAAAPTGFRGPFADVDSDTAALGVSLGMPLACDDYGLFFCGDATADDGALKSWTEALITDRLDPSTWITPEEEADEDSESEVPPSRDRVLSYDLGDAPVDRLMSPVLTEWDEAEFRRFVELCTVACPGSITRRDVVELISPHLETETADAVLLETDAHSCEAIPDDEAITRSQLLEMLMRALGVLPPLDVPPCELIS